MAKKVKIKRKVFDYPLFLVVWIMSSLLLMFLVMGMYFIIDFSTGYLPKTFEPSTYILIIVSTFITMFFVFWVAGIGGFIGIEKEFYKEKIEEVELIK